MTCESGPSRQPFGRLSAGRAGWIDVTHIEELLAYGAGDPHNSHCRARRRLLGADAEPRGPPATAPRWGSCGGGHALAALAQLSLERNRRSKLRSHSAALSPLLPAARLPRCERPSYRSLPARANPEQPTAANPKFRSQLRPRPFDQLMPQAGTRAEVLLALSAPEEQQTGRENSTRSEGSEMSRAGTPGPLHVELSCLNDREVMPACFFCTRHCPSGLLLRLPPSLTRPMTLVQRHPVVRGMTGERANLPYRLPRLSGAQGHGNGNSLAPGHLRHMRKNFAFYPFIPVTLRPPNTIREFWELAACVAPLSCHPKLIVASSPSRRRSGRC